MPLSLLLTAVLLQGTQLDVQFIAPGPEDIFEIRGHVVNGNPAPVIQAGIETAQTLPDGRIRVVIRGSVYDPVASCTSGEPGPNQLTVSLPDRAPLTISLTDGDASSSPFDPYRWEASFLIDVTLARMVGDGLVDLQCSANVLGLTGHHSVGLGAFITDPTSNRPLTFLASSDHPKPDDSERLLVRVLDPANELTEFDSKLRVMNLEWPIKRLDLGDGFYWYAVDENGKPAVFQTAQDGMLPGQIENVNGFLAAVAEKGGVPKKEVKAKERYGFIIKKGDIDAPLLAAGITGFTKEEVERNGGWNYFVAPNGALTTGDESVKAEVLWRMIKARKGTWRLYEPVDVLRRIIYCEAAVTAAKTFKMKYGGENLVLNKNFWTYDKVDFRGDQVVAKRQPNGNLGAFQALLNMWDATDGPNYRVGCWIGSFACAMRAASLALPNKAFEEGILDGGGFSKPFGGTKYITPTTVQFPAHLVQHAGVPESWLPGDWGYIQNRDMANGKFSYNVGNSGENIIYLGGCFDTDAPTFRANAKFWGLGNLPSERTLNQWIAEVEGWNTTNAGHQNFPPLLFDRRIRLKVFTQ